MRNRHLSRRDCLKVIGGAAAATTALVKSGSGLMGAPGPAPLAQSAASPGEIADRQRRLQWWLEAKFGMFIHWGLYSILGRTEWVFDIEGIPVAEYERLAQQFKPQPYAARAWAKLAKLAGQKYMVMTTKHLDGFCMFDTKYTNYCAPKQAAGRDLVREFVEAARAEGLRVGLYYCLFDEHHPDGQRCVTDEAARKRFVEYTHGQIRELMTNYGKIDILWYDGGPLDAKGIESKKMNQMVFQLQPDIIVNDRSDGLGDFSTPEEKIVAEKEGRAWETCMTMNDSWGYERTDDAWLSPKTIERNLITCAKGGGNYLLNIGPKGDGSVPEESVRILTVVGKWLDRNGTSIYGTERFHDGSGWYAHCTRKGNTLFVHVHFWPGTTVTLGGLRTKVKSARLLATGRHVDFKQDDLRVQFTGLPERAPDDPVTVIVADCESEPIQDASLVQEKRKREQV